MITTEKKISVLFTGYAPVHFVCFRPLFERFLKMQNVDVYVSGGLRTKTGSGYIYDERALFDPFHLPSDCILTVEEIRKRSFDVLYAANTKLIEPAEVKTRIQLFHGISFRNRAIRKENIGCDYYFLVGPYMQRKFEENGLMQHDDPRAVSIGFPKTDRLINGHLQRKMLYKKYDFDESKPVILYAPTGQKHSSLETMGEEVVKQLIQNGKYNVLVKLHDHPKNKKTDWALKFSVYENGCMRIVKDFDIIPSLHLADILITDASSVSSEYALVDRPMIFLDVPKLIKKAKKLDGSMLDMETWGRRGGVIVKKAEDILDAVEQNLQHPNRYSGVRHDMANDLFYNPGQATDAAMNWFQETILRNAKSLAS